MEVFVIDISGKVTKYSFWISAALQANLPKQYDLSLYVPFDNEQEQLFSKYNNDLKYRRLISLVPKRFKRSKAILKRCAKIVETFLNYVYIVSVIIYKRVEVVHVQFLPFADYISIEYYIFKILKTFSPNTKLILTIHDVLPHDISDKAIGRFCKRFTKVASIFDQYMVHNESSKEDVIRYFGIEETSIHIAPHPLFNSAYVKPLPFVLPSDRPLNVIMFGLQTYYKGTDLLVTAVKQLPKEIRDKFTFTIMGRISNEYYSQLKGISQELGFKWVPHFVSEEELDNEINKSDIIVLPYRAISQSGVLLLSLYFKKPIITSDLPSFKETLRGYKEEWFFESDNSASLAALLVKIANGEINLMEQVAVIDTLNKEYSLERFARDTIAVYSMVTNN